MKEASSNERIKKMIFGSVYPLYLAKVVKKGRTQQELDHVIKWLTGYTQKQIDSIITARQSKNLNQVQLAKLIMPNLNGDYIKNIENGKTPFNHVAYNRICKVLNIKPLPS